MMKAIKRLLTVMALGLVMGSAQAAPRIDVVKIINFSCQFCRVTEAQDVPLEDMAKATGGVFSYAALPVSENELGRELAYYAARNEYRVLDKYLRDAIFRGVQEESAPLEFADQAVSWLMGQRIGEYLDESRLKERIRSGDAANSLVKAVAITNAVGASRVPTYVILKNGEIQGAYDISAVKGASYLALKEFIAEKITSLSKE